MKQSDIDERKSTETLEHLLGVVVENREKRCAELRGEAAEQVQEIITNAHLRARARMHRHVLGQREKYRIRVSAALARNATLLRQQHQKMDRAVLDDAWPLLRDAMLALWKDPVARREWVASASAAAGTVLRSDHWHIEHPLDFGEDEHLLVKKSAAHPKGKGLRFTASDDIKAGIRIEADTTVVDATIDGLLQHRIDIEADLLARIKREAYIHE